MAHFIFVISQNAKWGHAGFYIDCHRMTVPENIFFTKSTVLNDYALYKSTHSLTQFSLSDSQKACARRSSQVPLI